MHEGAGLHPLQHVRPKAGVGREESPSSPDRGTSEMGTVRADRSLTTTIVHEPGRAPTQERKDLQLVPTILSIQLLYENTWLPARNEMFFFSLPTCAAEGKSTRCYPSDFPRGILNSTYTSVFYISLHLPAPCKCPVLFCFSTRNKRRHR